MNSVFSVFKSNSNSGNTSSANAAAASNSSHNNHHHKNSHSNHHQHQNGAATNNHNGHHTALDGGVGANKASAKYAGKKITHDSSYENLRHIREIESSTKMSSFIDIAAVGDDDDDDDTTSSCSNHTIRLNKRSVTPVVVCSAVTELALDEDDLNGLDDDVQQRRDTDSTDTVDFVCSSSSSRYGLLATAGDATAPAGVNGTQSYHCDRQAGDSVAYIDAYVIHPAEEHTTQQQHNAKAISASESNLCDDDGAFDAMNSRRQGDSIASNPATSCSSLRSFPSGTDSMSAQLPTPPPQHSPAHLSVALPSNDSPANGSPAAGAHAPIIVANCRGQSESNLSSATKTTNRFQKRLSLSGFANNSMPSVHGRPNSGHNAGANVGGATATTTQNGHAGGNGNGEVKRTRLSTHQRNLSLDFR